MTLEEQSMIRRQQVKDYLASAKQQLHGAQKTT